MDAAVRGLIDNMALVLVFTSLWSLMGGTIDRLPRLWHTLIFGLVMGLGAVAMMATPVEVTPGLLLDLRVALISEAALFGGPVASLVAVLISGGYRLFVGGPGIVAGIAVIVMASGFGLALYAPRRGKEVSRVDILLLSLATTAASFAALLLLPAHIIDAAMPYLQITVPSIAFLATLVAGFALRWEAMRRRTDRMNVTFRQVIESLPEALNVKDAEGRFTIANEATAWLMRAPDAHSLIGKSDGDFYPPETAKRFRDDELDALARGAAQFEQLAQHRDGTQMWLSTLKSPLRDERGDIVGLVTHNRDVTARKHLELQVQRTREQLEGVMAGMADGLVLYDASGTILFCNAKYPALFPLTADIRVPGANLRQILRTGFVRGEHSGLEVDQLDEFIERTIENLHVEGDREIALADGRWLHSRNRPMQDGSALAVIPDITRIKLAEKALSEVNRHLKFLASTDGLTGLQNRRSLDEALGKEFARSARHHNPLSVLMVDVDWFKSFNDTYGHAAGDETLKAVARCLKDAARRSTDFVARYGGEEFVLVLPETTEAGAMIVADTLLDSVRQLRIPNGKSSRGVVTVSIGVATFAKYSTISSPEDLLGAADAALYRAKEGGRDGAFADVSPVAVEFVRDRKEA